MDSQHLFILKTSFALLVSMATLAIENLSLASQFEACRPRTCGNAPNISYPFWISGEQDSFCGYPNFEVVCRDEKPLLTVYGEDYIINNISYSYSSFLVVNSAVYEDTCPAPLRNVSLDRTPFSLSPKNANFSFFYNCTDQPNFFNYSVNCGNEAGKYSYAVLQEEALDNLMDYHRVCDAFVNAHVRMDSENSFGHLVDLNYTEILKMGFVLDWTAHDCTDCDRSGGRCGFDNSQFVCFCQDGSHPKTCNDGNSAERRKKKIAIGIGCGFGGIILASIVIYFIYRYKKLSGRSVLLSRNISSDPSSINDSERGSSFPGVHLFSYSELEQATNHFDPARELGDGGFGTVYYGKLRDGRSVAVKRLYENNYRRVEQFLNEVEILTRLRHKNLVQLYGCTSRHSRELLLVYEFIQNGTVADHLHGQHAKPGGLPWPVRLKIAIETASALAYLHASDIIHRDVKTHNILLDDSFIVKVADFGLSRLFPTDVTHVSTAPQGTPGYVDPEYHQCYQLTDKSDVFSFGVVLIELISSKPAVDITRHRHEINLSNMAINKIQNRALHELVDPQLGFDSDYKVRKMITAVAEMAFQCLQYEKDMRPSMMEVLEALMRIENQDYNKQKAEEMDVSVEEVVLLKNGPPPLSPDSVTVKWNSSSESTASTISS